MAQWKKMTVFSGDVPTTEELALLKEYRARVELVIRARWYLLALLSAYGLIVHIFLREKGADLESFTSVQFAVPFAVVVFVAAYNAWYQYSYRWFAQIRALNQIQLLFDMILVTVVVHFSGGAVSWFWVMYLVLTLEAALIMDARSDTYKIALAGSILFGGLLTFEFYGIIPPVAMPFENNALQKTFVYEMIKWGWVSIVNLSVAWVAALMMETVRQREARLKELVSKDALTDLYNRRYFFYRFNSELERAKRYGRTVSLLILDVDDFKKFNDTYGHLKGDGLLRSIAKIMKSNIRRSDEKPSYELDIACRYGGEEFAVILPEAVSVEGVFAAERIRRKVEAQGAVAVAERIRQSIEEVWRDETPVTVSIGVASYPEHGVELEHLIQVADIAMYRAKERGKNCVSTAGEFAATDTLPEKVDR